MRFLKTSAVILLFVSEAFVGQVHPKKITLQSLVYRSACIFVVKKASPYYRMEEVPLDESGKHPPHQSPWYRYRFVEAIKDDPETKPAPGSVIEARGAHDKMMLYLDRKYALEGVSKSPILDFYESRDGDVEKSETFIVFLSWEEEGKRYSLTAGGAFEALAAKPEIKSLMLKSGDPDRPEPDRER